MFSASFIDLVSGFDTLLAMVAFGSGMAAFSAVEAKYSLARLLIKAPASSAVVESFENATAFGSMIDHFTVFATLFVIVFSSAVSATISLSVAFLFLRPPRLPYPPR